MDIAYAYHELKNVKDVLRECRINVESFHDQLYRRALVIAESIDVQNPVVVWLVDSNTDQTFRQQIVMIFIVLILLYTC